MTLLHSDRTASTFGAGGAEPYSRALRDDEAASLTLQETGNRGEASRLTMDVAKWSADADEVDLRALADARGPVLDVGCGPGRMVRAAASLGFDALGLDVSAAAVRLAGDSGLPSCRAPSSTRSRRRGGGRQFCYWTATWESAETSTRCCDAAANY
jgi:SAM-dependent methyltransferase